MIRRGRGRGRNGSGFGFCRLLGGEFFVRRLFRFPVSCGLRFVLFRPVSSGLGFRSLLSGQFLVRFFFRLLVRGGLSGILLCLGGSGGFRSLIRLGPGLGVLFALRRCRRVCVR